MCACGCVSWTTLRHCCIPLCARCFFMLRTCLQKRMQRMVASVVAFIAVWLLLVTRTVVIPGSSLAHHVIINTVRCGAARGRHAVSRMSGCCCWWAWTGGEGRA